VIHRRFAVAHLYLLAMGDPVVPRNSAIVRGLVFDFARAGLGPRVRELDAAAKFSVSF
jgi:hypothetical protein